MEAAASGGVSPGSQEVKEGCQVLPWRLQGEGVSPWLQEVKEGCQPLPPLPWRLQGEGLESRVTGGGGQAITTTTTVMEAARSREVSLGSQMVKEGAGQG